MCKFCFLQIVAKIGADADENEPNVPKLKKNWNFDVASPEHTGLSLFYSIVLFIWQSVRAGTFANTASRMRCQMCDTARPDAWFIGLRSFLLLSFFFFSTAFAFPLPIFHVFICFSRVVLTHMFVDWTNRFAPQHIQLSFLDDKAFNFAPGTRRHGSIASALFRPRRCECWDLDAEDSDRNTGAFSIGNSACETILLRY